MLPFQQALRVGVAAATLVAVSACSGTTAEKTDENGGAEGHVHSAQFGGTLVELGDHFAAIELTHDQETGEVALYTWDAHVENSERSSTEAPALSIVVHGVDEPIGLVLAPRVSVTSGEKAGDSSKFTGQSDVLKGVDHFDVTLAEITLKGQTFKDLEFTHPVDGHDHDHDGEDHGDGHDEEDGHDHDGEGHEDHGADGDGDDGHDG